MTRVVIDTNVPIVANGRADPSNGGAAPTLACRQAAIAFLQETLRDHQVLLDLDGEIQREYRRHLKPAGQPGVGDRFFFEILMSAPTHIERIDLPKNAAGTYADFPDDPQLDAFDPSDRKFAALARCTQAPVVNATDSDWLHHRAALESYGIVIQFVCGCDKDTWFEK